MNELQNFNFEGNNIRTLTIEDELHFVGKDVAEILGYSNINKAVQMHVDKYDKKILTYKGSPNLGKALWQGKDYSNKVVINESGLYALIFGSKLENAKVFKRWVTSEVLPTIRKHGAYMTDQKIEEALTDPDTIIKLATNLKAEREQRLIAEQRVNELQPKADYYDNILSNKGLVTISTIAKNYGYSANKFNELLHSLKVQFKQGKTWLLYAKYATKGYTHSEPFAYTDKEGRDQVTMNTKWTQKGHIFLYDLLKNNDILPMIERAEVIA